MSEHLTSPRTKRYGMTNFDDINVQDLLGEFDPLSSNSNPVENEIIDEDLSKKTKTSVQRLDSTENVELHRASGLILGHIQETRLANVAVSSSDERTSSGYFENGGTLESCRDSDNFDDKAEVVDEGKNSFV